MHRNFITTLAAILLCLVGSSATFVHFPATVAGQAASPGTSLKRLPDAVYFLDPHRQIARLEADGVTVTTVTRAAAPVTAFAVAPDGQRLAYISANRLFESEATGANAIVKVDATGATATNPTLNTVIYTPDGRWLTFDWNGIQRVAAGQVGAAVQPLLPNGLYPDRRLNQLVKQFFRPVAWSPDGQRLLVQAFLEVEGTRYRIFNLATGLEERWQWDLFAWNDTTLTWGRDSQSLLLNETLRSGPQLAAMELSWLAVTTGERLVVLAHSSATESAQPIWLFPSVHQSSNGALLAFGAHGSVGAEANADTFPQRYTMLRISADGNQITPLRTDHYHLAGDLLWAPDGSGALISAATTPEAGQMAAPLRWLPSDGSPALELPVVGHQMQWRTRTEGALPPPAGPVVNGGAQQATILTVLNVRSGPGTTFPILGQLAVGETVSVTGRTGDANELWWQIRYPAGNHQLAWIAGRAEYVQVDQGAAVPVVAPLPPPAPTAQIAPALTPLAQIHTPALRIARLSPDGQLLATGSGAVADFGVKLWRTVDGALLRDLSSFYTAAVNGLAFSPDGQWLVSLSAERDHQGVQIWRLHDGERVQKFGVALAPTAYGAAAFSPDGSKLAIGAIPRGEAHRSRKENIWIYDTTTWTLRQTLGPEQNPSVLSFSPDGRLLVTAGAPNTMIHLWQVSDWQPQQHMQDGKQWVWNAALSPDNQLLAAAFCDAWSSRGCLQGGVSLRRLSDGALLRSLTDNALDVLFSPDGSYLFVGAGMNNPYLRIYRTVDGTLVNTLSTTAFQLTISNDGNYLATRDDTQVQIWAFSALIGAHNQ